MAVKNKVCSASGSDMCMAAYHNYLVRKITRAICNAAKKQGLKAKVVSDGITWP